MTMQPTTHSRHQFIRDVLEITKRRMMSRVANATASSVTANSSSVSLSTEFTTTANLAENILGIGYILVVIIFLIKILLRTIRNFEYYYMSPSYNRFGFIANEESDFDSDVSDIDSSSSSPLTKCIHLQTPVQTMNVITPKTPAPLRRSLRLKIKSELNLCSIQNNSAMITRSQTKQNQDTTIATISSEPCPRNHHNGSMTTPSPHPEHDEERAYYIRYCNEKKMRKQRPEFNSPIFVRRLVL